MGGSVCVCQCVGVCMCVTNEMRPQRKNKRAGKHFGPAIICANILQAPKRDEPQTIDAKVEWWRVGGSRKSQRSNA